ncbi:hypothetical protein KFK09_015878 [Dendrobium nobile]|uniref:Uncharacterized protein n=1 Tax=Dendrobium nobile TaxID=94219 RepID=A0A8T3B784_DENNO|nr:hypothetical protein KFK09_015878 [Dendrobium nobile]
MADHEIHLPPRRWIITGHPPTPPTPTTFPWTKTSGILFLVVISILVAKSSLAKPSVVE